MNYRKLREKLDSYEMIIICLGAFLILETFISIVLGIGLAKSSETAVKDFIREQNKTTLQSCQEDADECHIEFVYSEDGKLLGGNVVGQSRK